MANMYSIKSADGYRGGVFFIVFYDALNGFQYFDTNKKAYIWV